MATVHFTAVAAFCKFNTLKLEMGSALVFAGFGCFAFWMCHG